MTKPSKAVNPNLIFVDTNVLIGGYSGDPRFQKDTACLHYLYSLTGKKLYISNNYKDYRLLLWIEATSPEKVRIIAK
jgi:hypothetical protein